jgi:hypothetical protein
MRWLWRWRVEIRYLCRRRSHESLCPRIYWFPSDLAVGVFFEESFWPAINVVTSTSSSVLFYGMVRFLQPSVLVEMDSKPVLREVMIQLMGLHCFLDLVSRGLFNVIPKSTLCSELVQMCVPNECVYKKVVSRIFECLSFR